MSVFIPVWAWGLGGLCAGLLAGMIIGALGLYKIGMTVQVIQQTQALSRKLQQEAATAAKSA